MQKEYYLSDIESGFKYKVTKEHYNAYIKMWELVVPKIYNVEHIAFICGTTSNIDNNNFYNLFINK